MATRIIDDNYDREVEINVVAPRNMKRIRSVMNIAISLHYENEGHEARTVAANHIHPSATENMAAARCLVER